ncbi:hypothetical protein [Thermus sediminis]|uniref:hypothetical protein n=1 Tax=Thermus sediminis TaxID=1761908 RepID=UPI000E3CB919|nr:hypothetical protein [Thermus sediminis]
MRFALRFRALQAGSYALPLPQDLPGQRLMDLWLSRRAEAMYQASGNFLARFALEEGEALEVRFALRPEPLAHDPPWKAALLREPPEAWPGILAHRGHRVERAQGFLLSGRPHTWFLVDGLPLDPELFQALKEDPARLLPLGVAPRPEAYLGGHEGKRLLLLKAPWPGEEVPMWEELRPLGLKPLPPARALAFAALGLSALGFPTGPWPYLPYLLLLGLGQGKALKDLFFRAPLRALEVPLFHAFALSATLEPRPELGLGFLGLFFWNRLRPSSGARPESPGGA